MTIVLPMRFPRRISVSFRSFISKLRTLFVNLRKSHLKAVVAISTACGLPASLRAVCPCAFMKGAAIGTETGERVSAA
jgi:hypothetical protein